MASVEVLVDSSGAAGFGHTYLKLTDANGTISYWGFYSDENDTLGGLDMIYDDGVVLDETSRGEEWKVRQASSSLMSSYSISDEQYTQINDYIQYRVSNPGNYFIIGDVIDGADNCASFVQDVLSVGGIENAFGNVPNGFTQNSAWFNWLNFTPEQRAQYITAGGLPWTYSENDYTTSYNDGNTTLIINKNSQDVSIIDNNGNFEVWEKINEEFSNVTQTYTIKSGDTLYSIAQSSNVTVDELLQANPWLEEQGRVNADKSYVLIKTGETINISKDNNTYSYDIENSSVSIKDASNNPLALESISNDILMNISDGYTTLNTQTKTLDLNTITTIDGGYGAIVNVKDTSGNDIFIVPDEYGNVSVYDNNGQLDVLQASSILNVLSSDNISDFSDTQQNISYVWNKNLISENFYSTLSRNIRNYLINESPSNDYSFTQNTTDTNTNPTTIFDLASQYNVSVSQLEAQNTWLKDRTSDSLPSVFKNSYYNTINIENNTGISYDYTYYESSYSNESGSINEDEIVQKVSFIKSKQIRFYQANSKKVA